MPQTVSPICPCGQTGARGKPLLLAECCGRYLDAGQDAPDALALMRSRYSAFVLARLDYLRATWHPDTCPVDPAPVDGTKWLGLQVRGHRVLDATHAEVEFVARYRVAGRAVRLHERSRFVNENGRWLYVDGDLL
jgi:SEC-C motif-containing protein